MGDYIPRLVDSLLDFKLRSKGAVVIEGAKWCGKTTTARQKAGSIAVMNDPRQRAFYREAMEINPGLILDGSVPRLIDEWQIYPDIWDAVRYEIDERRSFGQFILTGSVTPTAKIEGKDGDAAYHHSGAGRFSWLMMRPMTLFESSDSSGDVSLRALFDGIGSISGNNADTSIESLAWLICRGGWPMACGSGIDRDIALAQAYDYVDAIGRRDFDSNADGIIFDRHLIRMFLRSFARNIGTQRPITEMARDCAAGRSAGMSEETAYSYYRKLSSLFVIEDMEAWNPNLRSRTAIRTSPTHYFVDPSIAAASLGIGPDDLCGDLQSFGFWFKNLCIRDLRVYSQLLDGTVYHYRDKSNLECDAVIHLRNGSYGLVEIKLGGHSAIDQAADSLKKLASRIDTDRMKPASFLMVLIGVAPFAYRRNDGVYVVPVTCLKP